MPSAVCPPPRRKVFCVGLNKTGTTTFEAALRILGYRVTGPNKRHMQQVKRGRSESAMALSKQYDAFRDWPWPLLLEPLFARYGTDARYVLTVRKHPEVWLKSLKNHLLQDRIGKIIRPRFSVYGRRYPFGFEDEYLQYYEAHNERVREFFRRRDAEHVLLEVCWERGDGWPELCTFLGHETPDAPFPHVNATAKRSWSRTRQLANGIAAQVFARFEGRQVGMEPFRPPSRTRSS